MVTNDPELLHAQWKVAAAWRFSSKADRERRQSRIILISRKGPLAAGEDEEILLIVRLLMP